MQTISSDRDRKQKQKIDRYKIDANCNTVKPNSYKKIYDLPIWKTIEIGHKENNPGEKHKHQNNPHTEKKSTNMLR